MEDLDALPREAQRFEGLGRASRLGGGDFVGSHPQGLRGEVKLVETARALDYGGVAPRDHVLDDHADRLIYVLGHFALRGKKAIEGEGEIRISRIEPQRHQARPAAAWSTTS